MARVLRIKYKMHYIILPLEGMKEKSRRNTSVLRKLSEFMRQFNIEELANLT